VITTEFVRGMTLDGGRARDEERRRWAETLWRFVFRGTWWAMFNADPHPGNYLFTRTAGSPSSISAASSRS
jgi:predicted unusual protein kinase regulating ubiquinone biosynthesis (AarF/ABC1/UbiB family)